MSAQRSRFAGGDQAYLRDEQYRDGTRLQQRAALHVKYRTAPVPWFDWEIERFALAPGMRVLEAGCGTGWLWESAAPIPDGIELTLTDLSPGMVAEATARATGTGRFAAVTGREADLQELPFPDASFDRAIANHMLYHLPDPARGVAELARVIRPDGAVIAATNGSRHLSELFAIRGEIFGVAGIDETIDAFGADVGFAILRNHFDDVHWHGYADELRCTDPADVLAHICSSPPAEDASDEQLARLHEAITERFRLGGGTMTISKDAGCFVCRSPRRP